MKPKILIITFSFICIVFSIVFYYYGKNSTVDIIEEKTKENQKLSSDLSRTQNLYSSTTFTLDSLKTDNKLRFKYRALTDAMLYRDSIRKPLKYEIGDRIYLKQDSSHVLIKDIINGGGLYEYYIKYQILYRDGRIDAVSPELIY